MNKKLISVIIPIYNSEKRLDRCIASVIGQSYKNIEIILVNDGSSDSSCEICKKWENKDNRIKYFYVTNHGVSTARNIGIKESKGDYIYFIDSDDYIDENVIENLYNNTKEKTLTGINHNKILPFENKIIPINSQYKPDELIQGVLNNNIKGVVWCFLFDKNIIIKNNLLFDEKAKFMEDTVFLVEYLKYVNHVEFIEGSYYNYDMTGTSITRTNNKIKEDILNFNYALNKIEKIIDINYHDLIINKKIYLIDRELKKNHKKESYLDINDIEIQKILYSLNQEECINEEQKLFLKNLIEYNDNKSEKKL